MHLRSPFPDIELPERNVHEHLFNRAEHTGSADYTLLIDGITGHQTTYRDFVTLVRDGATALATPVSQGGLGLQVSSDEVVGILSENSMEYIALIHSLLAITTVFALLPSFSTPFELAHAIKLSKATILFVAPKLLPLAKSVGQECGISDSRICVLSGNVQGRLSFAELIKRAREMSMPQVLVRAAKRDTLAYLIFSSGTSGLPKAVMISHGNIITSFLQRSIMAQATLSANSVPRKIPVDLAILPMYHTYGLNVYSFRLFLGRTTLVILPTWDVGLVVETIAKWRVSTISLVPSMVYQLANYPGIAKADFSSLERVNSGGAYLAPEVAETFLRIVPQGATMMEGYGMSETTLTAIVRAPLGILEGLLGKMPAGATGILLPGMEARVLREDGTGSGVNEEGELWLRGSNIALGYWNDEKATRETFVNGWLRTGDQFRADEKGFLYFVDRAKDTLKVSGAQVSPTEIENVLLAHPDKLVADVAVVGVKRGRMSDDLVPMAWVVLSGAGKALSRRQAIAKLEKWTQSRLSKYKWLRGGIEMTDEIPKSPTGKVLRRVLQTRANDRVPKTKTKL